MKKHLTEIIKNLNLQIVVSENRGDLASQKPKLYFLIGPPAVGKSSWIRSNLGPEVVVVNRDDMVEKIAAKSGIGNYDDMFTRPPQEITPPGMPSKSILTSPDGAAAAERYTAELAGVAADFNADPANAEKIRRFGPLKPFTAKDLMDVIVSYGVPPNYVTPFSYTKIGHANNMVGNKLNYARKKAADRGQSMAIDMTCMSINERNSHRKFILNAIEKDLKNPDPANVSKYYDQIAIVFAPEGGYTEDMKDKIKKVAKLRAEEIKKKGGSKTIPDSAYDRMFTMFNEPTHEEGFTSIEYVGVPSLKKLSESTKNYKPTLSESWARIAGLLR